MAKKSYAWFEKHRRTKLLDLAQEQITTALDTVTLLHKATRQISNTKVKEATATVEKLFKVEEEVDRLRNEVFKELSKGAALFADYREDLLHLVKRLDTFADHVKDAARCIKMLGNSPFPDELWEKVVAMTATLVECATALRVSIKNISANPVEALKGAKDAGAKTSPLLWEKWGNAPVEPLYFRTACHRNTDEDNLCDPVRITFSVRQS